MVRHVHCTSGIGEGIGEEMEFREDMGIGEGLGFRGRAWELGLGKELEIGEGIGDWGRDGIYVEGIGVRDRDWGDDWECNWRLGKGLEIGEGMGYRWKGLG